MLKTSSFYSGHSASRRGGLDRLLQHELALPLHQDLCLVGQHRARGVDYQPNPMDTPLFILR
jgi:hypothetical protein